MGPAGLRSSMVGRLGNRLGLGIKRGLGTILNMAGMSYWTANTLNGDNQTIPNSGSSSAGVATFGSGATADSNDPTYYDWSASSGDYVALPGSAGNYLSHPDSAAVSVTGDITLQVECALDDWTSGATQALAAKWPTTNAWLLWINATGNIQFWWSTDGTGAFSNTSSAVVPFSDGERGFVRVRFDVDNGAGDSDMIFETSTDGETFTQLGTTQNSGSTQSINNSAAVVSLGSRSNGTQDLVAGQFHSAKIWDNATATGTPVMHWEASSMTQSGGADEESGETWTINRSTSGLKSALITRPTIVLDSAASTYLEVADHDDLDLLADENITFWVYGRFHDAGATNARLLDKRSSTSSGYVLYKNVGIYHDPVTDSPTDSTQQAVVFSEASLMAGLRDATDLIVNVNGNTVSDTVTTDSLATTAALGVGANPATGSDANDFEAWAWGVLKGTALTSAQLDTLKTELDTLLGGRTGE